MDVHFFTEYHSSTEQDYVNTAKGGEKSRPLNTTRIREEDTIYIRLSAPLLRQISQARRKALVKRHNQTENDPDDKC